MARRLQSGGRMALFSRPDGNVASDVPAFRRMMPFLMPTRVESTVYFEQELDLTRTLELIDAYNARSPRRITLFHVFLWAAVRTLHARPRLNRFVSGGRVYDRDGIWISYSAKKSLDDGSAIVVPKRRFEPTQSFDEIVDAVHGDVAEGRSDKESHVDKELKLALRLPSFLLSLAVRCLRWLDAVNLLPGGFIRADPMYSSVLIANLGSVQLESAYHHLYEYGTISTFAALGRIREVRELTKSGAVTTRTICSVKYSIDERIEDGLYCARSLELLRDLVENFGAALSGAGRAA
jgi:pyruvate/2-oxoglutarate dehydrogenase complex dihydrolipoamide acyltransferase (E2) component